MNIYVPYGRFGDWLCRRLKLPARGTGVPVALTARVEGGGVVWDRQLGDLRLVTRLRPHRGLLEESAGCCVFQYRLEPQLTALVYRQARVKILGVPVPSWLGPTVDALITSGPGRGWHVKVSVRLPILGIVCHYRGPMEAQ